MTTPAILNSEGGKNSSTPVVLSYSVLLSLFKCHAEKLAQPLSPFRLFSLSKSLYSASAQFQKLLSLLILACRWKLGKKK